MQRRGVQALPQPARRLNLTAVMVFVSLMVGACLHAAEFAEQRRQVLALGDLTTAPTMTAAAGFAVKDGVRPVLFEGLPWRGRPTKVFAWLGIPKGKAGKLPGVVLVHGGGGTAFRDWVKRWTTVALPPSALRSKGRPTRKKPTLPMAALPRSGTSMSFLAHNVSASITIRISRCPTSGCITRWPTPSSPTLCCGPSLG